MKKIFALMVVLCCMAGLSAQTVNLAYFPFTDNEPAPNTPTSYLATSGTQADVAGIYLDGTHGSSAWISGENGEVTANNGTTINTMDGTGNTKDLAFINQSANGKSFVIHFSTEDYQNINVSFAARYTATGFNSTVWEYSTDGTTFTALPGYSTLPDTTGVYELVGLDLTGVPALNEQANVYLRCTLNGASSANGSYRIDNVQINAVPAGPDVYAPILSSYNVVNASTMTLTFNEPMDPTTAENTANYVLDHSSVAQAVLNSNVVTLTFNPDLTEGIDNTLTISNVTDVAGNAITPAVITFVYGVSSDYRVANIAELRSKMDFSDYSNRVVGDVEYKLEGAVVVTAVAAYNNQKYIQDETGAILIYDQNGIFGNLSVGDKVSGLYGTLTNYYGFLEFIPTHAYETMVSILEDVTPLDITLEQLNDNTFMSAHQAELLKLSNVTFNAAGGTFAVLNTYEITQNGLSASAVYPYFQDVEYIGGTIPSGTLNLTGVNFATTKIGNTSGLPFRYYVVPRMLNDFGTGLNDYLREGDLTLYPNPANNTLYLSFDEDRFDVTTVQIFDITGKLLMTERYSNGVNVSNLTAGCYFIRLSNDRANFTTQFIKQ